MPHAVRRRQRETVHHWSITGQRVSTARALVQYHGRERRVRLQDRHNRRTRCQQVTRIVSRSISPDPRRPTTRTSPQRPLMPLTMRIGDRCLEAGEVMRHARVGCEHVRVASITREDIEAVVRDLRARLHPNAEFLEAILTGKRQQYRNGR